MSRNVAANGRKDSHVYTSQDIAAMSLDQLRELSDLQLSERELADVIQAIHAGGAGNAELETGPLLQLDLPEQQCLLCQQAQPAQCLVCQGGSSVEDIKSQIQQLQSWLDWNRIYQLWASQRTGGLEGCQAVSAEANST